MNNVGVMKHLWWIVANKESLWVKWILAKYLKQNLIWTIKLPNDCSWPWRKLLKLRAITEPHIRSILGSGNNTHLWLDNWHPNGVLIQRYVEQIRCDSKLDRLIKVNKILSNGEWCLFPTVSTYIVEVWSLLHTIETLNLDDMDIVVWKPNLNGEFSTSSMWNFLRDKVTKIDWADVVWCSNYFLKHTFLLWRVLKGRLPTLSKLCKMEILTNAQCHFCWNDIETLEHLFFWMSFH